MATVSVERLPVVAPGERVVLPRVSWEAFERLSSDEVRRVPRLTYDRGVLELVGPSMPHEEDALTIGRLVDIVAAVTGIRIRSVGHTTFRREDLERGFEPDGSFYVQSEGLIRGKRQVDLSVDPPPDLVIEMEVSRSAIDKLDLFASMGIPEVWRCDDERVTFLVLDRGTYRASTNSLALPVLTPEAVTGFLAEIRTRPSPYSFETVATWARVRRAPPS